LSLDPKAREYPSISDYAFVAYNPILFVDPDGCNLELSYDSDFGWSITGSIYIYTDEDGGAELLEQTEAYIKGAFEDYVSETYQKSFKDAVSISVDVQSVTVDKARDIFENGSEDENVLYITTSNTIASDLGRGRAGFLRMQQEGRDYVPYNNESRIAVHLLGHLGGFQDGEELHYKTDVAGQGVMGGATSLWTDELTLKDVYKLGGGSLSSLQDEIGVSDKSIILKDNQVPMDGIITKENLVDYDHNGSKSSGKVAE